MARKVSMLIFVCVVLVLSLYGVMDAQEPDSSGDGTTPATVVSTPGDVEPAAVPLGAPGLSYRYVRTFGVTSQAYISDTIHINRPHGLFMDSSNNLYVAEEAGYRVLRYNFAGSNTLVLGQVGVCHTDNYTFCTPQDQVLDDGGNLWVADGNRVVQYDSVGVFLQQFPATDSWMSGNDNTRFDQVHGIAFDGSGRMYVSDTNNHRVQVFDLSTGSPVYSTTIGITGISGNGATQFNGPQRLTLDSSNRLYVVDSGNNRVQRCTYSGTWSCTTLDSGFNDPRGIAVDTGDNIYIADTYNRRVRKCTSAGTCTTVITEAHYGLFDLAVDSTGNIYGAAIYEGIVAKYSSSGNFIRAYIGEELVPYVTDGYHYNRPRVAIDSSNNIIVLEENGQRLLKLDPQGAFLWAVGVPGVDAGQGDNTRFSWPHGVAVDTNNNIYVADNTRVQIFDSNGVYFTTLGTGYGTGNYQFAWATGVAVDSTGSIYVADGSNHRVQIYNSNRIYVGSIGSTGQCGSTNDLLCWPIGLAVDSTGNIYIADAGNARVQKFNSNRQWKMTIGTLGNRGEGFSQFNTPEDIEIDPQGRIYVTDIWNNRVQVFDSNGAYLTTIGGSWGTNTGQMKATSGVALDSSGNVYVADFHNSRIQKFAPGVPGWQQANINGFGTPYNRSASSLEVFNGHLYAGATNFDNGGTIWRTSDGATWTQVSSPGFSSPYTKTNAAIIDLAAFNGDLYASTGWGGFPGQLWRSSDGINWQQVASNAFGTGNGNAVGIAPLAVFNNRLYAGTCGGSRPAQIWRSDTGDSLGWTNVVTNGNGSPNSRCVTGFMTFGANLYASVENGTDGMQIWRSSTGDSGTWNRVNTNGFGSANNSQGGGFAVFNGQIYIGTRNNTTGAQLWRSQNGIEWSSVTTNGFGDTNNQKLELLFTHEDKLYVGFNNPETGAEIWQSANGMDWQQINADGFGDSNNDSPLWSNSVVSFNDSLYVGTWNWGNGGEVWQLLRQVYLPALQR